MLPAWRCHPSRVVRDDADHLHQVRVGNQAGGVRLQGMAMWPAVRLGAPPFGSVLLPCEALPVSHRRGAAAVLQGAHSVFATA